MASCLEQILGESPSPCCEELDQKARLGGPKIFENDSITGTSKSENGNIIETQICAKMSYMVKFVPIHHHYWIFLMSFE